MSMVNNKGHFLILCSNFKKAYVIFFFQIDVREIRRVYSCRLYETILALRCKKTLVVHRSLYTFIPPSNDDVAFYDWHASVTVLIPNRTVTYFIRIVGRGRGELYRIYCTSTSIRRSTCYRPSRFCRNPYIFKRF